MFPDCNMRYGPEFVISETNRTYRADALLSVQFADKRV